MTDALGSEMVERVEAVLVARLTAGIVVDTRALARAAIEAIREPTRAMVCAAMNSDDRSSRARYVAMIDAALSNP